MQNEKIGAVTLDYRYYPGEDKYSDGSIEDEMLELARTFGDEDYNRIIARKSSWPILYHFSHVRRNVLSWLPMTGQERVLEIGAGPGAITGILAERAGSVTCVDLSRKRCLINAYRNRRHENIRILVGNFQDITASLEEQFDLITLIGVFEYAQFSIQSEQPFLDYLLEIRRLLAPGGRLVIAIENRLGLKYWAGATEDHTGIYFEGLEGYPTTDYVRTFSRPELESLFEAAGFGAWEFYYPYPDYKLPDRIYSDRCLPGRGELNRNIQNFDRERMQLFDEERVYDSLAGSGLYPVFANSYIAVLRTEDEQAVLEKAGAQSAAERGAEIICCSRYSNERDERFRIRTDILEDREGRRVVRKQAEGAAAQAHIASVYQNYGKLSEDLKDSPLSVNRCEYRDGSLYLEWLQGDTLESELDALLLKERPEALIEKIRDYFQTFSPCKETFCRTPEFDRVFGAQSLEPLPGKGRELLCRKVSDIDMVFSNVIHTEQGYQKIDFEWTFEFPIPVKFLQYRCIHYYLLGDPKREKLLREHDLYGCFGISAEEQKCFERMETQFQQYILGDYQPLWRLYDAISDGVIEVEPLVKAESGRRQKQKETAEVFFDAGSGFSDRNCQKYSVSPGGMTRLAIEVPEDARALRIDPGQSRCVVRVQKLEQAGEPLAFTSNGLRTPGGDYLFDTEDPQLIVPALKPGGGAVQAVFFLEPMEGITREALLSQDGRLRWIEQTRAWRLYRRLRRLLKREV